MISNRFFLDAVNNLSGGCSRFQVKGDDLYENITWLEGATAQPTKEEVDAEVARLNKILSADI